LYGQSNESELSHQVQFQGLSGLVFDKETYDQLYFWSLTDRGPNREVVTIQGQKHRPFIDPKFQPKIFYFSVAKNQQAIKLEKIIALTNSWGVPLDGLPQCDHSFEEEKPISSDGFLLKCSPLGIDPESLAIDSEGNFWIGEEYGPSILKFTPDGRHSKTYVPGGKPNGLQILPKSFALRRPNRGIEALAIRGHYIYAMLQSPLLTHRRGSNQGSIQIVQIDIRSDQFVRSYWYPMNEAVADKIGDMTFEDNDHILIVEQNSKIGPESNHKVFRFDLRSADAATVNVSIRSESKQLALDLVIAGYDQFEKLEGLTLLPNGKIAVVNDNDFGVIKISYQKPAVTILSIFQIDPRK
jgi:hypothetical protein